MSYSNKRQPPQQAPILKTHVAFKTPVTVAGAAGVGFGTAVIGDFPEGNVLLIAAVAYVDFTAGGANANIIDTWEGDYSIGTTPTADATLATTDANIIPSTAIGPAAAEAIVASRASANTAALLDNTDGSLEINLNLIVDDLSISANGVDVTASGYVILLYTMMGDD